MQNGVNNDNVGTRTEVSTATMLELARVRESGEHRNPHHLCVGLHHTGHSEPSFVVLDQVGSV